MSRKDGRSTPDDEVADAREPVAPTPDITLTPRDGDATVLDTRAALAHVAGGQVGTLASSAPEMKSEADEAEVARIAFEAEATRRANIMIGDQYIEQSRPQLALDAYKDAGATEKLVELGDRHLRGGNMSVGLDAYAAAGVAVPTDVLVLCGDVNLTRGNLGDAAKAYEAAGVTDKLALLGEKCLEAGDLFLARKAYAAAGRDMPNEKLLVCAERCLADGRVDNAIEAYAAAGQEVPKERLMALGDLGLEKGTAHYAVVNAYKGAEATDKLIALGDRWYEEGEISSARMAYREAGAMDKVMEIGNRLYDEMDCEGALNAYSESGRLKEVNWGRLRKMADHLLRAGRKRSAVQAYEAVNDTEMLLMLGKRWLERNELLDAENAFRAVARIQLGVERVLGGPVKERYASEPRKRRHG